MKKKLFIQRLPYSLLLGFVLIGANTFSFAQEHREERKAHDQQAQQQRVEPQRPAGQPQRSPAADNQPQRPQRTPDQAQRPQQQQRPVEINRNPDQQSRGVDMNRLPPQSQRPPVVNNRFPDQQRREGEVNRSPIQQQRSPVISNSYDNDRDGRYGRDYRSYNPQQRQGNVYANRYPGNASRNGQIYQRDNSYRRRYERPPVIWQGRSYYSYHPYVYHAYHPYYYNGYRSFGFFSAFLGVGAFSFMLNSQPYYYDEGVYYQPYNNGYRVIAPPISASVNRLPDGYTLLTVDNDTFYYYAGTFYIRNNGTYIVVEAPAGAVVYDLPEGVTELRAGDITYLQYNNVIYQPITLDGREAYEVVELDQ